VLKPISSRFFLHRLNLKCSGKVNHILLDLAGIGTPAHQHQ
jgi:hypothetical protein